MSPTTARLGWWLLAVGAVAGGWLFAVWAVTRFNQSPADWPAYVSHGVGGLLGALVASWRDPQRSLVWIALAAATFVVILAALTLGPAQPHFGWMPARGDRPLVDALLLAAVTVGGALAGGWLGRRIPGGGDRSTALAFLLVLAILGLAWIGRQLAWLLGGALALLLAGSLIAGCGKSAPAQLAGSSGLPEPVPGDFTIVLIPDTQYYTLVRPDLMTRQMAWIADNAERLGVVFAIHLGDMTNDNTESQWLMVDKAMRALDEAGVPWSPMPGNHDGIKKGIINSTRYNKYFPISRFSSHPWYGGHHGDTNDSTYWLFSAGGMDFMVLSLAFGTPDEQLAWANQIATAHPDRRIIFATHAYLDDDGTWLERGEEFGIQDERWRDGREIWEQVVRTHANIFLAVCGHVPDQAKATVTNQHGTPVHHILANYQGYPEGGDGWLRLLRFSPARDEIYVEAYSPTRNLWDRSDDQTFRLAYEMPDPPAR